MDNLNSAEYLEKIKVQVIENLKRTTFAPSVQMNEVPRDPEDVDDVLDDADEDENKDSRWTKRRWDKYVEKEGELSESEDEDENERNGVRRQPGKRRRNIMDYQNLAGGLNDDEEAASDKRGRSREPNGATASAHSSPLSNEGSEEEDEDVEMADSNNAATNGAAVHPQEATPPDSPPEVAAAPTAAAEIIEETGDQAMDEGDVAKDEGRAERDAEDVAGRKPPRRWKGGRLRRDQRNAGAFG